MLILSIVYVLISRFFCSCAIFYGRVTAVFVVVGAATAAAANATDNIHFSDKMSVCGALLFLERFHIERSLLHGNIFFWLKSEQRNLIWFLLYAC